MEKQGQKRMKLCLSLLMLLSILFISQPFTVKAEGEFAADVSSLVQTVNSTGGGSTGGSDTVPNGMNYTRTGYLCYLINNPDGTDAGYPAYAFTSPGYSQLSGTQWVIKSRRGHTVGSWKNVAPWECTPWTSRGNNNVTTNEPEIKRWFNDKYEKDLLNSQHFVSRTWGVEAAQKFQSDEIVIAIETLVNCQFAEKADKIDKLSSIQESALATQSITIAIKRVNGMQYSQLKAFCNTYGVDVNEKKTVNGKVVITEKSEKQLRSELKTAYSQRLVKEAKKQLLEELNKTQGKWESTGQPVVGTLPNLLEYRNNTLHSNTNCFVSYITEVIPKSERIENSECGFTAYDGGWRMSEGDIPKYGVAMMLIHCKDSSAIRTYWEPNGSPGNPEPNDPPKNGFCNIVKGYYEENETTGLRTGLGVYSQKDCTNKIIICDEPEFQLVRWDIGSTFNKDLDPTNWNPPLSIRNGTTPQSVTLKNPEKTVYVLLKKVINEAPDLGEVNYNLSQSTITRRVDFSEPDSQTGMAEIHTKEFTWSIGAHITTCNHTWTTNDSCPGNHQRTHSHSTGCPEGCNEQESYNCGQNCVTTNHSASCEWGTWEDSGLRFTLKNTKAEEEGYTKILGTQESKYRQRIIEKGEITGVRRYADRTRSTTDATEYPINNWDYRCVLWRGKDQLIVAEWKNDDLGTSEANTDLEIISSVDNSGFRIADNGAAQREKKDYKEEFSAEINDDSPDKRTTYKATTGALVNGNRVTPCPADKNRDASLKEGLDIDVKVKYDVYSGSTNGGYNDTYCSSGVQSHNVPGYNKHNGIEVPSGGEISFKPYIKMNYSTYDNKDPLTAYVLGEHTRSITPNDYAEICWNEQSEPNLRLTSLQWSTHKAAADKWGAGNVLPGGAALSLSIPPESRQEMILTTYQIILEGSGKAQAEKTGGDIGNFTRDKATEAHQAYVNSVVQGIESLNVEQWVNTTASNPAWSGNGHAVNFGKDISFIGTSGLKASDDMKYYFNDDGTDTPASEGDLDVKAGSTRTETYTFFTNTDGEVRYIKDNVNPNVGSETMGETASGGMADFLNERTHIVDKLEKAVERNTGNDAAYGDEGIRSGKQRWYNEAFDGVTVIMQQTKILAGYVNPPERTTVLDPRLCKPNKAGQSGMFAEGSYSSSQYKCKEYTQAYGEKNQVGLFKNQAVYTDSLDKLFKSKVFYIANMNTEDLH